MLLDTIRTFETPEGIDIQMHVAGPISRAAAWLIDSMIRACLYFIAIYLLTVFGNAGIGLMLIIFFLIEWLYPVFFEVFKGATPGKKLFKLLVCNDNGTPINWQASMTRNLLRAADFLPFFYFFGLLCMLMNRDFKRLGDIAAGTIVIYQDRVKRKYKIPDEKSLPFPQALSLEEQQAILEFAERTKQLSKPRRAELANFLQPLTQCTGEKGEKELLRYANWILRGNEHR